MIKFIRWLLDDLKMTWACRKPLNSETRYAQRPERWHR